MSQLNKPDVVLIGRINVGKSTLFNKLVGQRQAIVSPEAGTTRDTNLGRVSWSGQSFWLVDTGGFGVAKQDELSKAVYDKVIKVARQAKLIVWVIDGQTGFSSNDEEFSRILYRLKRPVVIAANKIDGPAARQKFQIPKTGFRDVFLISAKTGSGVGDLLDFVLEKIKTSTVNEPQIRVSLIGKTNVGKSSLFNKLLRSDRSIVLPTPHTTRDRQVDYLEFDKLIFELRDTAGVRRQLQKAPTLEQVSVKQSLFSFNDSDVIVFLIDGSNPLDWQDQRLAGLIKESNLPVVMALNKSDLTTTDFRQNFEKSVTHYLPMLEYAPRLWLSANTGHNLGNLMTMIIHAYEQHGRSLSYQDLKQFNRFLHSRKPTKDLPCGALYQDSTRPPVFVLPIKTKENLPQAISSWVESRLRDKFGFSGSPLRVKMLSLKKK